MLLGNYTCKKYTTAKRCQQRRASVCPLCLDSLATSCGAHLVMTFQFHFCDPGAPQRAAWLLLLPENSHTGLSWVPDLAKGGNQLRTDAGWLQLKELLHLSPLWPHNKQQRYELCRLPWDFPFQRFFAKDFCILQNLLRKRMLNWRQCQVPWLSAHYGPSFH